MAIGPYFVITSTILRLNRKVHVGLNKLWVLKSGLDDQLAVFDIYILVGTGSLLELAVTKTIVSELHKGHVAS